VTKKNRKARRLMALYPDVQCRILYQRDYFNLLVKYGLEEPSQGPLLSSDGGPREALSQEPLLSQGPLLSPEGGPGEGTEEPPLFGPALAG
jgi:hypothetical protein